MIAKQSCSAGETGRAAPVFNKTLKTTSGETRFRRFHCDAEPQDFDTLAPVAAVWQSRRLEGKLPRWQDFAIEDFVGWHRNIGLSDVGAGLADPRFRLFGSGATELIGANLTGKAMSEVFPTAKADGVLDHFTALRDGVLIGLLARKVVSPGREHMSFLVIELPLAGDDGKVAQFIHCFAR